MPLRSSESSSRAATLAAISERLGDWSKGGPAWRAAVDVQQPVWSWAIALLVRAWPRVRWLQLGVIAGGLLAAAMTYLTETTRNRGLAALSLAVAVAVLVWIVLLLVGALLSYRLRTAASARYERGNAALARAAKATGAEHATLLDDATRAYLAALAICPRQVDDTLWAATQLNLGAALEERAGLAADVDERARLLEQSASALWAALEVYTPESATAEWTATLMALGGVLEGQAAVAEVAERVRLLGAAAAAYEATIEVQTREVAPHVWARTQAAIGATQCKLAALADDDVERARLLGLAVDELRAALEVFTRETAPIEWASAQSLLATAMRGQIALVADDAERTRLLDEALAAIRLALEVRTRWVAPEEWAALQNELGMALRERATLAADDTAERARLLDEAVAALDAALEVRTREAGLAVWAATQRNLGGALRDRAALAEEPERARLLGEAAAAYHEALRIFAPEGEAADAAAYGLVREELAQLP